MLCFKGTFQEIKGISADNFRDENLNSSVFFLSHVHEDHMPGLNSSEFLNKLLEPEIYLYSSSITTKLLQKWYPDQAHKFCSLSMNRPKIIDIPGENSIITVVAILAEHCPGSVMFLFTSRDKTILYTGDFRYELNVLDEYKKYFLTSSGKVMQIDKIYLDVTFFQKKYPSFPPRELALTKICEIIEEWIELNEKNKVIIKTPANYGSEFLYKGIWDKLKLRICVSRKIYTLHRYMPQLEAAVTLDANTKIKALFGHINRETNMCLIIPSAKYWVDWDGTTISEIVENGNIRICFSCHSSYEEIVAFLKFLKPKSIEPNVLPSCPDEQEMMHELIKECIQSYTDLSSESEFEEDVDSTNDEIISPKRKRF